MEARAPLHDGLGILRHLAVEQVAVRVAHALNGIHRAHGDAAAAADAFVRVDVHLAVLDRRGVVGADLAARAAADALGLVHGGLAVGVHFLLARAGAAAHAEIFDRATDARGLVALEVGQGDDDIGIHQCAADAGVLYILAVNRNGDIVRALQAVGNDDMAARRIRREAVDIGGLDVVERVLAAADIERVAVRQERLAAELAHKIRDGLCIIRAQVGQVARLAEVHFNGDVAVLEIDLIHPRRQQQTGELLLDVFLQRGMEGGKVDFRCGHVAYLLIVDRLPRVRQAVIGDIPLWKIITHLRKSCKRTEKGTRPKSLGRAPVMQLDENYSA